MSLLPFTRARKVRYALGALVVIGLAALLSPRLALVVAAVSLAGAAILAWYDGARAVFEAAALRNDIATLRTLQEDPRVRVEAKIALIYARDPVAIDVGECACGGCNPARAEGSILARIEDELHFHARLARSFWEPIALPKGWMKEPAPGWSRSYRSSALLGFTLGKGGALLTTRRLICEMLARPAAGYAVALRWPLSLAAVRYLVEAGLYQEAQDRLAAIPRWPEGSYLEGVRRRCEERVEEHRRASPDGAETLDAERRFLRAALEGDVEGLLAIARSAHHARYESRLIASHLGADLEGLPPLDLCPCASCDASGLEASLSAHRDLAKRLWVCGSIPREVFDDAKALESRSRGYSAPLTSMARALHACGHEDCAQARLGSARFLERCEGAVGAPERLAAATFFEGAGEPERAKAILGTVTPFRAGSPIEAHRHWLSERVGATP